MERTYQQICCQVCYRRDDCGKIEWDDNAAKVRLRRERWRDRVAVLHQLCHAVVGLAGSGALSVVTVSTQPVQEEGGAKTESWRCESTEAVYDHTLYEVQRGTHPGDAKTAVWLSRVADHECCGAPIFARFRRRRCLLV
jgi:hypothetical protein